jgi:hypothetical protein
VENRGKRVKLFERQEFWDIDVDKFINFSEVFFVNKGVVETSFEILKVEKHSFNGVELRKGKAKEIVPEKIVKIETVILLLFLGQFDHSLSEFLKFTDVLYYRKLTQTAMILIVLVAGSLSIPELFISFVVLKIITPGSDVIPHELIDPYLFYDRNWVYHDHRMSENY